MLVNRPYGLTGIPQKSPFEILREIPARTLDLDPGNIKETRVIGKTKLVAQHPY
jgi:hypothetical protein